MAQNASFTPSAEDRHPRKRIRVLDSEISYVELGEGDPIVFLCGNPTSPYLWRNVIPFVRDPRYSAPASFLGIRRQRPASE